MTTQNRAAWLNAAKEHPFEVRDAPMPSPGPHDIVIRVHAAAVNPADWYIQTMGMILQDYPAILGWDLAGEVVEIGSEVSASSFKRGDRVMGIPANWLAGQGGFQLYANLSEGLTAKLPDEINYKDACVLPIGVSTAASAMFQKDTLNLPLPRLEVEPKKDQVLLIWAGSSSVGSCAIQLAKAAGLEVAATASGHNLEYLKSIGADYVFNHKDEDVVEQILKTLKGKQFMGAFDTVFPVDTLEKCGRIAEEMGGKKFLSTVLAPGMEIEAKLPEGVRWSPCYCTDIKDNQVGPAVWGAWATPALASGALKCKPDAHVVGQGLEKVQEAVDRIGKGASAQKFVVEIP